MNDLKRMKQLAGLNESSSDISVKLLMSFIKDVAIALERRDIELLESMKSAMDDVFDDDGNSLVQNKNHLIDNAVAIISDLKMAEKRAE